MNNKNNDNLIVWIGFIPLIAVIITAIFVANIFITQIESNNESRLKQIEKENYINMKETVKSRVDRVIKRLDKIKTKKEAQSFLINSDFDNKGYFFAYSYDGVTISHIKKDLIGINRWDLKKDGKYVLQDLITVGRQSDGGYLDYTATINPITKMSARKISFINHYDRFGWIIGTGVYSTDINNYIYKQKEQFNITSNKMIETTIYYVVIFTIIILMIILIIHRKLKLIFDDYENRLLRKDKILHEQAKLAAMGEMIGAIAHQWRQPLNALSLNIQSLDDDYDDGLIDKKFIDKFIDTNKTTIKFMSNTIDDFRNFFRIDNEKIKFSIKESIQSVINIQSSQLKFLNISLNIKGNDFDIVGYESEFKQVVLNIINNAKDEITNNNIKNGKIDILLKNNQIQIKDNAGGIPLEIMDRIFEPYFTTKKQGQGTGIGLYMSKMIIEEKSLGTLSAKNDTNGAIFTIRFNNQKV
ncbi:MAG: cache domain-containing protein [Campylobacterota bacterium]|nr:cache domain-containing protein [Campylobacterota bacterium]